MNMDGKTFLSLRALLDYIYNDEKQNCESSGNPKNHIFHHIEKLNAFCKNHLFDETNFMIDTSSANNTPVIKMRIVHLPTGVIVSGQGEHVQSLKALLLNKIVDKIGMKHD